jgi:predicted acyltransferase (DUF342 family)
LDLPTALLTRRALSSGCDVEEDTEENHDSEEHIPDHTSFPSARAAIGGTILVGEKSWVSQSA